MIHPTAIVAKRYVGQQKCLKKWIGSALLGTWWGTTVNSPHRPWAPHHRQTERQITVSCQ